MLHSAVEVQTKMKIRRLALVVVAPVLVAVVVAVTNGCMSSEQGDEEASATTTAALQAQSRDGVIDAMMDIEGSVAPEADDAAKTVAESPRRGLRPEGCSTSARVGNTVVLTLNGCTGPFGNMEITGTLRATFSKPGADVLHIEIVAGEGTTANGSPLDYSAAADVRFHEAQRSLDVHGRSSGTTRRGKTFARQTDLAIVADVSTHCASIDGTSSGQIGSDDVDLTIEGFKGCRDACPTAGVARATVNGPLIENASITATFDGSDRAHVKVDRGTHRRKSELDVAMDCAAAEATH